MSTKIRRSASDRLEYVSRMCRLFQNAEMVRGAFVVVDSSYHSQGRITVAVQDDHNAFLISEDFAAVSATSERHKTRSPAMSLQAPGESHD